METAEWVNKARVDFTSLEIQLNGKPPVYFDNACGARVYDFPATPDKVKAALQAGK